MTTNLQEHQDFIIECLSKDNFESIYNFLLKEKLPANFLLSLYRQGKKIPNPNNPEKVKAFSYFTIKNFWKSQLPLLFLKEVLESDLKVSFFQGYFSKPTHNNHILNKKLCEISVEDFIKFVKLSKSYRFTDLNISLSNLSNDFSKITVFEKELKVIISAEKILCEQETKDNVDLLHFSLGEVLMAFTLFHYQIKQDTAILGNKGKQTQVEVALLEEIERILNLFARNNQASEKDLHFLTNQLFQDEFRRYKVPHWYMGKEGLIVPLDKSYKRIIELINRAVFRKISRNEVDLYLGGFADCSYHFLSPAFFETNSHFNNFQFNNSKSQPEEFYLSATAAQDLALTNDEIQLGALSFYGIPGTFKFNGAEISLAKALRLLRVFSSCKGPDGKMIDIWNAEIVTMKGGDKFAKIFGANEHISLLNYDKLVQGISNYFSWSKSESQQILGFLLTDLTHTKIQRTLLYKPFIKIEDHVLWLGTYMKERRWENVIINRFRDEDNARKQLSTNFETQICKTFQRAGFKTICGMKFKTEKYHGEIDVLAFKDNCLFIVEAKSGKRSDDFSHATYTEVVRLEGCAAEQLSKILGYIHEEWKEIRKIFGIDSNMQINDIKMVSLIVTDYFEGDLALFKNNIHKISLLELDVMLTNRKRELLESYEVTQKIANGFNPNFKGSSTPGKNWDLWNGGSSITALRLIEIIEKNGLWEDLESMWDFKPLEFSIYW